MANKAFWKQLRFFRPEEFSNPEAMDEGLLTKLDLARKLSGRPFRITSSWRPDDPDRHSAHEIGKAVDISCSDSRSRYDILRALFSAGFTRVGVYDQHLHVDVADEKDFFPREVLWWGISE